MKHQSLCCYQFLCLQRFISYENLNKCVNVEVLCYYWITRGLICILQQCSCVENMMIFCCGSLHFDVLFCKWLLIEVSKSVPFGGNAVSQGRGPHVRHRANDLPDMLTTSNSLPDDIDFRRCKALASANSTFGVKILP